MSSSAFEKFFEDEFDREEQNFEDGFDNKPQKFKNEFQKGKNDDKKDEFENFHNISPLFLIS